MFKYLSNKNKNKDVEEAVENIIIKYDNNHLVIRNPWWIREIRETAKYCIVSAPKDLQRKDVQKTFSRAFHTWTTFILIKFIEVPENEKPDIIFRFLGKCDNHSFKSCDAIHYILEKDKKWVINENGTKFDENGDDLYSEVLTYIGQILKGTGSSIGRDRHPPNSIIKYKPVNDNGIYFQPYLTPEDIIAVKTLINEPYEIRS